MLVLIDNYDSFTYNLAQYLGQLGEDVVVFRNDAISVAKLTELVPDRIVISPGPCTPNEAGISMDVIEKLAGKIPIFGVCLGHQAIAQVFGARIIRAREVMHGKVSKIFHDERGVFAGIENPLMATRYHSLIIDPESLPPVLEVTAKTWESDIMGIRHRGFAGTSAPLEGVQFHPESIHTPAGMPILERFITMTREPAPLDGGNSA
ncbi:MAG TPA: aminodeoxychorismate/anthranilate synthase component II [Kofleriaceae bacterium]|nr:aminodeoxychorismate/anthranilate synthase component II [Kofleriaceae bacterium]